MSRSPGAAPACRRSPTPAGRSCACAAGLPLAAEVERRARCNSPASSWPSMTGAAADTGIVVLGTTVSVRSSLADDAGVEYDVAIVIDFCSVVVPGSLIAAPGSVVSVFVSVNLTVVSAPGASGPYGFDVASSVKSAGARDRHRAALRRRRPVVDVDRERDRLAHAHRLHRGGAAEPRAPAGRCCSATGRTPRTCPSGGSGPRRPARSRTTLSV